MKMQETRNVMCELMTVVNSLKHVCNDLDFIATNQVPPIVKLLNSVNDTVLACACDIQDRAVKMIELQAKCEILEKERNMMMDYIGEQGLTQQYLKHTEKYD